MTYFHVAASSTASVSYVLGGAYNRVNCTNSDQTLLLGKNIPHNPPWKTGKKFNNQLEGSLKPAKFR